MKFCLSQFCCLTACFIAASTGCAMAQAPPPPAAAAPAAALTIPGEAKQAYIRVRGYILKAVDKMPEENYSFQPTSEIRPFAALVNHITAVQMRICSGLNGQVKPAPAPGKTKAEIAAALKQSFDECDKAYDAVTPGNMTELVSVGPVQLSRLGMLYRNVTHDNEMYGTISVYMRLKGIVPPSSEAPPAPPK